MWVCGASSSSCSSILGITYLSSGVPRPLCTFIFSPMISGSLACTLEWMSSLDLEVKDWLLLLTLSCSMSSILISSNLDFFNYTLTADGGFVEGLLVTGWDGSLLKDFCVRLRGIGFFLPKWIMLLLDWYFYGFRMPLYSSASSFPESSTPPGMLRNLVLELFKFALVWVNWYELAPLGSELEKSYLWEPFWFWPRFDC